MIPTGRLKHRSNAHPGPSSEVASWEPGRERDAIGKRCRAPGTWRPERNVREEFSACVDSLSPEIATAAGSGRALRG